MPDSMMVIYGFQTYLLDKHTYIKLLITAKNREKTKSLMDTNPYVIVYSFS